MLLNTFKNIHVYEHIFSHAMLFWTTLMNMLSIFTLWTFHLCIYYNIPETPSYCVYISHLKRYHSAFDCYQEVCYKQESYRTKGSWYECWSHHVESLMVAIITWLTVTYRNTHMCVKVVITFRPFFDHDLSTNC
jgi:hypothetical protein